jgi:hypothetical protein
VLFTDIRRGGLDPSQMAPIDNSCPDDTIAAGVSSTEASKEKLEWKDVFELTEWFRPAPSRKTLRSTPTKCSRALPARIFDGQMHEFGRG